jgi:hypothetical protein
VLPLSADSLYWSAGLGPGGSLGAIGAVNPDGSGQQLLHSSYLWFAPDQLAVDSATGQIFSTDYAFRQIEATHLNGTGEQVIASTGSALPFGITVDSAAGKIYWDDGIAGHIFRSNLDGSGQQTVLSGLNPVANVPGDLGGPGILALDTVHGKIYWTDAFDHMIMSANLDGTGQQVILRGLNEPSSIAVDPNSGKLYWTDWNATIHVANLDGSDAQILLNAPAVLSYGNGDLALDVNDGKLFWEKDFWNAGVYQQIWSVNLDGSNPQEVLGGFDFLGGIAVGPDPVSQPTIPAAIPEPATLGLAALGVLALTARKRRTVA